MTMLAMLTMLAMIQMTQLTMMTMMILSLNRVPVWMNRRGLEYNTVMRSQICTMRS